MPVRIGTSTPSTFKIGAAQVSKLYMGANSVWSNTEAMLLSATPPAASGYEAGATGSRTVTSNAVTITASGGTGGAKTYSVSMISGGGSISPGSPSSATSNFSANLSAAVGTTTTVTGTARWTVSDGTYTSTIDVPVELSYERD